MPKIFFTSCSRIICSSSVSILSNNMSVENEIQIFYGNSNIPLVEEVCQVIEREQKIKCTPGKISMRRFSDGEFWCQIQENVRGKNVFVIQSTCSPVNEHLMELFLIVDALRRASSGEITAIIPYFGYARQDRKSKSRVPISASLVAKLIESSGVNRVIAVDLHCGQIQGFFSNTVPVDNLYGKYVMLECLLATVKDLDRDHVCCVSPDAGGTERAESFRELMTKKHNIKATMAVMNKYRSAPGEVGRMELIGDVKDTDVVIVDDMADTCGTLVKAAEILMDKGAKRVFACVTHGLLNGNAVDRLENGKLSLLIITNSVPLKRPCSKVIVASLAQTLAKSIMVVKKKISMSVMFEKY